MQVEGWLRSKDEVQHDQEARPGSCERSVTVDAAAVECRYGQRKKLGRKAIRREDNIDNRRGLDQCCYIRCCDNEKNQALNEPAQPQVWKVQPWLEQVVAQRSRRGERTRRARHHTRGKRPGAEQRHQP